MAIKTFTTAEVLTAADTNTYLANSGLVFVKSQTVGSAVSSVTVSSAFSSTYDDYKIIWSGGQSSAATEVYLQLDASGTPSTTGYYGVLVWGNLSTGAVSGALDNNAARFTWAGSGAGANNGAASLNVDLLSPNLAKRTRIHNAQVLYSTIYGTYTGLHDLGNSYNGFKLIPASGTISNGTITVYGYRKE